ncbi:MAG: sodium/proton-translocating pyrophosphatase, partial [Myxococcota bacterium]
MDATLAQQLLWAAPVAGVLALAFGWSKSKYIERQDAGTDRMREIAGYIREGAMAFLGREYKVLTIFALVVAGLLTLGYWSNADSSPLVAVSFLAGAICSGLAGYFGMRVATSANVRTTHAARTGLVQALDVAFSGGTVMGMCVVGLGVIGLSSLLLIYHESGIFLSADGTENWPRLLAVVSGFSLGASSIALFARVGGGIFTKAADIGADLVGKVEAGIPEDDPRNPAVIADNVGDNVGDVAGMGADLFESYVGSIVGAMVLAAGARQVSAIFFPLVVASCGILVAIASTFLVRMREGGNPQTALNTGMYSAAGLMVLVTGGLAYLLLPNGYTATSLLSGEVQTFAWTGVFGAVVAGLVSGTFIGLSTEYYTAESRSPARGIAEDSQTGAATNIISGLALGMRSTAIPVILIGAGIMAAHKFAGLYGIAMAALGMLSTIGIQLAVDAYG